MINFLQNCLLVKQQKGSKVWEDSIHKLEFHEPKLKNI